MNVIASILLRPNAKKDDGFAVSRETAKYLLSRGAAVSVPDALAPAFAGIGVTAALMVHGYNLWKEISIVEMIANWV